VDLVAVMAVLCVNVGSSSVRVALRPPDGGPGPSAAVTGIGSAPRMSIAGPGGVSPGESCEAPDHPAALAAAIAALDGSRTGVGAIGHRLVHGGPRHRGPARIDARLRDELSALTPLAPVHLPLQIAAIDAVAGILPDVPQAACFDTAFHRRLPETAQRLPLPEWAWEAGVRRYGFHGLSCEHVVASLAGAPGRTVIAHLGGGSSLTAVRDGVPVDTTMALTPAGGVMMGTRSGDLDPGVAVHLMRAHGLSVADLDELVNRRSGLLGVSGRSADMRDLLAVGDADPRAARAVAMFCACVAKAVGALATTLGGLDVLVFTGGIGENAAEVRARICRSLAHLGVRIDEERNRSGAREVEAVAAACAVRVVPADEEAVIARQTSAAVFGVSPPAGGGGILTG
jgi:acetate kinase